MHLDTFSEASPAAETGKTFLRHALRVWARENGVSDDQIAGVVRDILDFAVGSLHGGARQPSLNA